MRSPRDSLRGSSLRPDWVLGLPRLIVSGSRGLGAESAGRGWEFKARDCWRAGGHSLGAARCRLATQLRREAPPGRVRAEPAHALGEGMDGSWAEQRESLPVLGKRRGTAKGGGELKSCPGGGCQNRSWFLDSREGYGLGKTLQRPRRGWVSMNFPRPFG